MIYWLAVRGAFYTWKTVLLINAGASKLPFYGRAKDAALDTVFGPPEEFEYVSTTATPSSRER